MYECVSRSVVFNSWRLYGLKPSRLPCPWDSPVKNTGVDTHALLQAIFLARDRTQVSKIADRLFTI